VDFFDNCEPSLLIINRIAYVTSKVSIGDKLVIEIKVPISGKIMKVFVAAGIEVKEGSILASVQAVKWKIRLNLREVER
jgi:biotin carboxyl carrier protein